jgi:rubredoxin
MAKVIATDGCGHVFDIDTCTSELKMVCETCGKVYDAEFVRENNDLCPEDSEELGAERVYQCPDCKTWYRSDDLDDIEDEPETEPATT